jgi:hypothetical protein
MMEAWNSGIMGYGIVHCWVEDKIKNRFLPFKNQHSSIP